MKEKILMLFLCIFLITFSGKVNALSVDEIRIRNECPIIELADAKEDGSLVKVECYQSYQEAKDIMMQTDNDNLVLVENGMIIDAKYAVVDYNCDLKKSSLGYIQVFVDKNSNVTNSQYLSGGTPDEAAMLDVDYNSKRVKIKVAGLTGWINRNEGSLQLYDIVPLSWVKTPQYYQVTNDTIRHHFPINVYGKDGMSYTIDRKPTMLAPGNYYSYDGNYFYTDLKIMLQDYKNSNYEHAVNKDKPYYNYYQYLSFRTKTNYTAENIDAYLSSRIKNPNSKLLATGEMFISAQNNYGVNAVLMLAIGINESSWGFSPISQNKNNLFGLNAVDKTPGESANYFASVKDCIDTYSYSWLSYGFLQPGDTRFKGANLGNKYQGLNYRYASDPFWAEKAASYYYDLDSQFDFQDHNAYQIAVLNNDYSNSVYAKKTPGGENISTSYYQYRLKNSAVVVLGEVEGPAVNGNTIWYKIMSDPTNYTNDSKSNPRALYDWNNSSVYVSASYFTKVNTATGNNVLTNPDPIPETPDPDNPNHEDEKNEPITPPIKTIQEIVTEANYKYDSGNIFGISPNTNVETLKNSLTNVGGIVTITDSNGNIKESGNIGTGDKVSITSGITEVLTVLIYGDINGDGQIDKLDASAVLRQYYGYQNYNDVYQKSLDVNRDGVVDKLDASAVLRSYYGYDSIKQ